jgi:hypothetical protein
VKHTHLLAIAAALGIALTGCAGTQSSSDTDASSSSSSGTMRRAESGSNTSPNPDTRNSDCIPGDTRQNCPPDSDGSQSDSLSRSSESATDVETPDSGAPTPR